MLKIASFAVVGIWVAMLAVLAGRQPAPGPEQAAVPALQLKEDWMGIYLEGRKIGYAVTRVDRKGAGYGIDEEMNVVLTVMGTRQEIHTVTRSSTDESLVLMDFDFSMKSGLADMEIKGAVDGALLKLDITTAGRRQRQELALRDRPRLTSGLEMYLLRQGIEVGKKYRMPFFDPATLSEQYMELTVEEKEEMKLGDRLLPVYRVREEYAGVTAKSWINPEQGTIKGEGPMGFTFLKETKEQALKKPEEGTAPADIIALVSVPVEKPVPEPRKAVYMKARLTGADFSGIDLSGGRQEFRGGVVSVTAENLDDDPPAGIPARDEGLKKYLMPETFVQSDDPKLREKAREITGNGKDPLKAAMKLAEWVNRNIEKKPSAGIPSAVEVLGNLSGDCNEHTVLYTALARSVGIPARMAAGIVMLDGRFYYHAWPEVYAGRWISIDPTFGQFPADATHIKFVEGAPDRQVAMLKVVGKLKAEVLEYR